MPTKQKTTKAKKSQFKPQDLEPTKNPKGGINQKGTPGTGTGGGAGKVP